jgi:hypothetical protein
MPGLLAPLRYVFNLLTVLQPGFWISVDTNWMRNQVLNLKFYGNVWKKIDENIKNCFIHIFPSADPDQQQRI